MNKTNPTIDKRWGALRYMQQQIGWTFKDITGTFKVPTVFIVAAAKKKAISKTKNGYIWNSSVEPDYKLAEEILEEERKIGRLYDAKTAKKKKTFSSIINTKIKTSDDENKLKALALNIEIIDKKILIGLNDFVKLINL